jgi:hypothetical protein
VGRLVSFTPKALNNLAQDNILGNAQIIPSYPERVLRKRRIDFRLFYPFGVRNKFFCDSAGLPWAELFNAFGGSVRV